MRAKGRGMTHDREFRLFRRRDRSPSVQSPGPPFSVLLCVQCLFEPHSGVSGSARVRVCMVPRSVHSAATVCTSPGIHSGLLHHLHTELEHGFCAVSRECIRRYFFTSQQISSTVFNGGWGSLYPRGSGLQPKKPLSRYASAYTVDVVFRTHSRDCISRTMNLDCPTVHKVFTINQRHEPWRQMQAVLDKMEAAEQRLARRVKICGCDNDGSDF
ncbi:hypothetical protein EVAR_41496_1 [Eumeta japonica]|uniref:Uncharacterized protein n=1 Tax=Eumeta variegata TaxID=151549 RepID=A0A4C1X1A9_EUMVA|nr:hypothetical protein EVAR_41496_1 [Eumeta japonica]